MPENALRASIGIQQILERRRKEEKDFRLKLCIGVHTGKALVGKKRYGWIPRIVPAKIGVPEKRLTIADKFYFRYQDLYALIAGLLGFVWGTLSFRIRPA